MKQRKNAKLWLELTVIAASLAAFLMLMYFVILVSFQDGAQSTEITLRIASYFANSIFEYPTSEEIYTVSRVLRYGAHLALFFAVGAVTSYVSMVIFKRFFRIAGVLLSCMVCYILAYYTEYYKQFIDGRHFQRGDVVLNWYGSLAGIICMVISYFLIRLLVKIST